MNNLQNFISEVAQESINSLISFADMITRPEMLIYFMWVNFAIFNGLIRDEKEDKYTLRLYRRFSYLANALFLVFLFSRVIRNWDTNIFLAVSLAFASIAFFVWWSRRQFRKMVK
jgi:hypothetical protein